MKYFWLRLTDNRRWVLFVFILLLMLLVTTMPARVIGLVLPSQLALEGLSGTFWQGRAARARLTLPQGDFFLGQMTWRLSPFSLLLLQPRVHLETRWGVQKFAGEISVRGPQSFAIRQLTVRLDAGLARHFAPLYVGGNLQADIESLRVDDQQLLSLQGRLVWESAAWTARTGDVALGTYVLDITGDAGDIHGEVVTLSGPLTVAGELALVDQRYRLALNLAGSALSNLGLRDALALIAVPTEQGFDVTFEGAVPAR